MKRIVLGTLSLIYIHAYALEIDVMKKNKKHCVPCEGGVKPLTVEEVQARLHDFSTWHFNQTEPFFIERTVVLNDFKQAMAFVNEIAFLAEREGHHPDMAIHYNRVVIKLHTHAIGGLSENDFILAGFIDELINTMQKNVQKDQLTTMSHLKTVAEQFVQERDWQQFHSLKNLSMTIAVEAAELMEHFTWRSPEDTTPITKDKRSLEQELSDVLLGLLCFSNRANIDIAAAFAQKLALIKQKYPAHLVKGKPDKYTDY